MVEQLKKPNMRKSKSFSFKYNEGSWNESNKAVQSDQRIPTYPEKGSLNVHDGGTCVNQNRVSRRSSRKGFNNTGDERSSCESGSPASTRSPMKILRPLYSCDEGIVINPDHISARVPLKRRKSFMPITTHSRSTMDSSDTTYGSPGRAFQAACPVFELDDESDEDVNAAQQLPRRRRNSFMPSALRGVSLSPKPVFKKQAVSSLHRCTKPLLLRTLSYNTSSDTCKTEAEYSEHTRSTTSTPTSSSSDLQQDEHSLESVVDSTSTTCVSLMETSKVVNLFDLDKSTRSNDCNTGCSTKKKHETSMSFVRSMTLVIGAFLWHYLKLIGSTLSLKTIIFRIWMTLFDVVIEAFSITVELMSYAIPITLRIFETSMLWFVQQVHIRRLFILVYNTFKRRHNDVHGNTIDETPTSETISNPIEKSNRRPIRFLYISKDNVRRSIRVGSYKD